MLSRGWIDKMEPPARIAAAKAKTTSVVDHLLYLIELHENNALVVYSPLLASQIPKSHAANAFVVFQRGLHQIELVRLCAIWDGVDPDKENVPTIIELIDHERILNELAEETAAHWCGIGTTIIDPDPDPKMQALVEEAVKRSNEEFGQQQGAKARVELKKAIDRTREIMASSKLQSIMNLRDKHLAHSLSQTRREQKVGPIAPMKYGDERAILDATVSIVEALYCWVCGRSFSFRNSREIDQRNARALWERCKFTIDY